MENCRSANNLNTVADADDSFRVALEHYVGKP